MPSKSRKTRRRRKRKRTQKQRRFAGLKRKLEQGPPGGQKIVIEPSGEVKMSAVLEDFVEPYREFADTEEDFRKLLTLGVVAWNASLLPEEKPQQDMVDRLFDEALPGTTGELKADLKEVVNALITRKKTHFSEYTRAIIDFELTDVGRGYHLSVASTLKGRARSSPRWQRRWQRRWRSRYRAIRAAIRHAARLIRWPRTS